MTTHLGRSTGRGAARAQGLLDGLVGRQGIRHAVAVVEGGDGSPVWSGACGPAATEGPPMRPETPFHFASVTKPYTAVTALRLVERGELGLDAPIASLLPRGLVEGIHRIDGVDRSDAVTVRHLLAQTSGLADYFLEAPGGEESYDVRMLAEDFAYTVEDVAELLRHLPAHFPPQDPTAKRQRARYADSNYQLLGAVIAEVAGRPFPEAVEAEVLRPLGLDATWMAGRPRGATTTATAAMWAGDVLLDRPAAMRSMAPDGGLVGTAADALAFLRALLSGEAFDDPDTLGLMRARFQRFGLPRSRSAMAAPSWPIAYGLGLKRFRIGRVLAPGSRPITLLGHSGASGSWLFHCPELDLSLAGTVDQAAAAGVPYRLIPRIARAVAG